MTAEAGFDESNSGKLEEDRLVISRTLEDRLRPGNTGTSNTQFFTDVKEFVSHTAAGRVKIR